MEETGVRIVEVFRAFEHGELRYIGLSVEQVRRLCPASAGPGWSVASGHEPVSEAVGVVHAWPSGRNRVHWVCPLCGGEHISDFEPHADGNPALWFCERGDGMCLVHWECAIAEPGAAADPRRQFGFAQ
jgi:hypothetical protein